MATTGLMLTSHCNQHAFRQHIYRRVPAAWLDVTFQRNLNVNPKCDEQFGGRLNAVSQEDALSREVEAMAEKLAGRAWRSQPHHPQPSTTRHPPKAAQQRVRPPPLVFNHILRLVIGSRCIEVVLRAPTSRMSVPRRHRIPAGCCPRWRRMTSTWRGTVPPPAGTQRTLPRLREP